VNTGTRGNVSSCFEPGAGWERKRRKSERTALQAPKAASAGWWQCSQRQSRLVHRPFRPGSWSARRTRSTTTFSTANPHLAYRRRAHFSHAVARGARRVQRTEQSNTPGKPCLRKDTYTFFSIATQRIIAFVSPRSPICPYRGWTAKQLCRLRELTMTTTCMPPALRF
jgi:hypothetical protein